MVGFMQINEALTMTQSLLEFHKLTSYIIRTNRSKSNAGTCRYIKNYDHEDVSKRVGIITLSTAYIEAGTRESVMETILHEIAHALAGPSAGHGPEWKKIALSIGSNGSVKVRKTDPKPDFLWQGVCAAGHKINRHRLRSDNIKSSCPDCCSEYSPVHLFNWYKQGSLVHKNW